MRTLRWLLLCILGVVGWAAVAFWLALQGWWLTPVVSEGDAGAFLAWGERSLDEAGPGAAALVLLEAGEVVGEHYLGGAKAGTLFPTASMSKWIAALAVQSLVEEQRVELDQPVSSYLTRWQLPPSDFPADAVTVRRLLSHTAGLTDRLGFGDYRADEMVPSLEESLRSPRASEGSVVKIAVGLEPGSEFLYSGGGYLVLELLVEEVSGQSFADYVTQTILSPLAMKRSGYRYLGEQTNAAASYNVDGSLAPTYRYASAAATAFSSTAEELSRLVKALLLSDEPSVNARTAAAMRSPEAFVFGAPIWGLGTMLYAPTAKGDYVFGHDGANDPAINTTVRVNPETGDAVIVLVSGHPTLASSLGAEWVLWQTGKPDFLSFERALQSALAPLVIGSLLLLVVVVLLARRH